jgi:hypothetical protein
MTECLGSGCGGDGFSAKILLQNDRDRQKAERRAPIEFSQKIRDWRAPVQIT